MPSSPRMKEKTTAEWTRLFIEADIPPSRFASGSNAVFQDTRALARMR
jgi:hypothetical protein